MLDRLCSLIFYFLAVSAALIGGLVAMGVVLVIVVVAVVVLGFIAWKRR